jgi:hypothetical protein
MMTQSEIRAEYWAHEIKDGKFSWKHPNVYAFFGSQGIKQSEVRAAKGSAKCSLPCSTCGTMVPDTISTRAEKKHLDFMHRYFNPCEKCVVKQDAEIRRILKEGAPERERRIEARRASLALEWGLLFTGEVCPKCLDGFLVVRLSDTTQEPFLSCSNSTHTQSLCRYTQCLAPELRRQYLEEFRRRLDARVSEEGAKVSQ